MEISYFFPLNKRAVTARNSANGGEENNQRSFTH
jgi:hypothetical protein